MLQACLNGGRTRSEAGHVPLLPDELASDARSVCSAGARELHVHPRDNGGVETLLPDHVSAALTAIRAAVPGVPVGIGTGAWIAPGGRARHADMAGWTVLPDYVSINLNEEDAPSVMAMMAARGVGIEAGVWSLADARRLIMLADRPVLLRILVEMPDAPAGEALSEADAVIRALSEAGLDVPVLLHGEGESAWPCIAEAARIGCDTRIGLEDTLVLPDGSATPDNATLVRAALELLTQIGQQA